MDKEKKVSKTAKKLLVHYFLTARPELKAYCQKIGEEKFFDCLTELIEAGILRIEIEEADGGFYCHVNLLQEPVFRGEGVVLSRSKKNGAYKLYQIVEQPQ